METESTTATIRGTPKSESLPISQKEAPFHKHTYHGALTTNIDGSQLSVPTAFSAT